VISWTIISTRLIGPRLEPHGIAILGAPADGLIGLVASFVSLLDAGGSLFRAHEVQGTIIRRAATGH
jgi:hypothetical protein